MRPFTQEMQGAYELARKVKEDLDRIPRAKDKHLHAIQGIMVEHFIGLLDLELQYMELDCQSLLDEMEASV